MQSLNDITEDKSLIINQGIGGQEFDPVVDENGVEVTLYPFQPYTSYQLMQFYWDVIAQFNSYQSRAVEIIANHCGTIPLRLFLKKTKGMNPKNLKVKSLSQKDKKRFIKKGVIQGETSTEIVEVEDHPALNAFKTGCSIQNNFEVLSKMVAYLKSCGNGYIRILRDNLNGWIGVMALPTHMTRPVVGGDNLTITGYRLGRGGEAWVDTKDLMHFREINLGRPFTQQDPSGLIEGSGCFQKCWSAITNNALVHDYDNRYLTKMGMPSIKIEYPQTVSKETIDQIKQNYREIIQDPENIGLPLILTGGGKGEVLGDIKNSHGSISSGGENIRNLIVNEIATVTGIPPEWLMPIGTNTGGVYEASAESFYQNTLIPTLTNIQETINKFLHADYDNSLFFAFDDLIVNEEKSQAHNLELFKAGAITRDELRATEGWGKDGN